MITAEGYSKDPMIVPEGIVITFARTMMADHGGEKLFIKNFIKILEDEERHWMHKCSNMPKQIPDHIYIIVMNRLWGRVYCGGMHRYDPKQRKTGYSADGKKINRLELYNSRRTV